MDERSPVIPVEVVPPELPGSRHGSGPGHGPRPSDPDPRPGEPITPFHPLAAGMMILFDGLWGILEIPAATIPLTVIGCFITVFISSFVIQRRKNRDGYGAAFLKALFLGVVAAVPFPVMGTSIGLALLAWFGIKRPRPWN